MSASDRAGDRSGAVMSTPRAAMGFGKVQSRVSSVDSKPKVPVLNFLRVSRRPNRTASFATQGSRANLRIAAGSHG